jgi:hypothetical protein
MKKILLASFLTLSATFVNAQCTPEWPSGGGAGIVPDSATNLPSAYELMPYSATVNFKVPLDTVASLGGFPVAVTIENITVTDVTGLSAIPSSVPFTYTTNPANGTFPGNSIGCALITGTPAAGSSGVYNIQFSVTANAVITQLGTPVEQPYTIDYYKIVVQPDLSVQLINGNEASITSVTPNPAIHSVALKYYTPVVVPTRLIVYNTMGQTMSETTLNPSVGLNNFNIDLTEYPAGNYFVGLFVGERKLTTTFTVNK